MNGVVFVFFLIYAEAIYRRGSIVNSSCLPFSMGMKKSFTMKKDLKEQLVSDFRLFWRRTKGLVTSIT